MLQSGEEGHVAKRCAQSSREPRNVASDKAKNGVLSLSARIKPTRCAMTMTENRSTKEQAVGPKTVGEVLVFGRKWTALLDTGSEISIMPVNVLQRALDDGYDIDHLERPLDHSQKVYDAPGNRMQFIAAVEVPVVESGNKDGKVNAFMYVAQNAADTIILGTNVLSSLGYKLMREGADQCNSRSRYGYNDISVSDEKGYEVVRRQYIPPGATKQVTLRAKGSLQESESHSEEVARIFVHNASTEPVIVQKWEQIEEWEK